MNGGRIARYPGTLATCMGWDDPSWHATTPLEVDQFLPRSSDHRPRTTVQLLYDSRQLAVLFRVEDRYVRAIASNGEARICKDSCVEVFLEPLPGAGYFNFEWNCGGALWAQFYAPGADAANLTDLKLPVCHSLPEIVDPEVAEPLTWHLLALLPFSLLTERMRMPFPQHGDAWRANFYKCGSGTSHPHWASAFPLDERGRFHNAATFAPLLFD